MKALMSTDLKLPGQISKYTGKVREVYFLKNDLVVMIATDRISAFDVVMPKGVPYKGQVLNQIANYMLDETSDIIPNWLKSTPDPNVSIGLRCDPFKIEMVDKILPGTIDRACHSFNQLGRIQGNQY